MPDVVQVLVYREAKMSVLRCLISNIASMHFSLNAFSDYLGPMWQEIRHCIFSDGAHEDLTMLATAFEAVQSLCSLRPPPVRPQISAKCTLQGVWIEQGLSCESFSEVVFNESRLLDLIPRLKNATADENCLFHVESDPAVKLMKSVSVLKED